MAKSTMETVLDVLRIVNTLDRKGRLQIFRYLDKEFQGNPVAPKPGRHHQRKDKDEPKAGGAPS